METFTEQEAAEAFGVELEATGSESGQETPEGQGVQGDVREAERAQARRRKPERAILLQRPADRKKPTARDRR